MKGKNRIVSKKLLFVIIRLDIRHKMARLQLENGVLQEKIINEKRKVSILEVNLFHLFDFI